MMMSEPLWSMDKWWHEVQQVKGTAKIAGNNVDYIELADAEELFEKVITDYGQRIQELEAGYEARGKSIDAMAEDVEAMHAEIEQLRAELERLRELVQWHPLPDGCYEVRKYDARLYVSWPAPLRLENGIMTTPSIYTRLPDDIALCRRNADAQPQEDNHE